MTKKPRNSTTEREMFKKRAKALLDELNLATGPQGLEDWNIRASTLLTFEVARLIATQGQQSEIGIRKSKIRSAVPA